MFKTLALFVLFASTSALAYPGQIYNLFPGQSLPLGDGSQVVCQGGQVPPVPPPPIDNGAACTVKYNPSGNSCQQYVVYDSKNRAVSECLANLDDVRRTLHDMYVIGTCRTMRAQACEVKFNPSGNSCMQYVVYGADGKPLSGCLANINRDVEPAIRMLKDLGICAY